MKRSGVPRGAERFSLAVIIVVFAGARGASLDISGQASGWLSAGRDTSYVGLGGLRYLPDVQSVIPVRGELKLDAEVSANALLSTVARVRTCSLGVRLKPYRALARISAPRFYVRAGLQEISFGSAALLRPLQWFDQIDPRDPLGLTDGVYGLLARYYFQDNTNIWTWGLLGNSSPKLWEAYGSERWAPEPGARVQVPVPRGEVAATFHHRRAVVPSDSVRSTEVRVDEDRVGLDGKWDVVVGLWFEAVLIRSRFGTSVLPETWQRAATLGADYTIGIGPGLLVTAEQMLVGRAGEPFGDGTDAQFSALMLSLPLGLLDNLKVIAYYDWSGRGLYRFVGWQRTLDRWSFNVTAFWNPERAPRSAAGAIAGVTGLGAQLMVVFNH